jgi:hypothetical protein
MVWAALGGSRQRVKSGDGGERLSAKRVVRRDGGMQEEKRRRVEEDDEE